jgi:membrane associated rhomboid family serine protease
VWPNATDESRQVQGSTIRRVLLPIRDVNPTHTTPVVTFLLIGVCVVVYLGFQATQSPNEEARFLYHRAAISCELTSGDPLSVEEITQGVCDPGDGPPLFPDKSPALSVLVSMFLHGGLGHLVFNMWFLWIFGNNVEEAFGHLGYTALYLVGGIVATMVFVMLNIGSTVPLIGASGAIASVLGAYAALFPRHRVLSLLGWLILPLPAIVFLGLWLFAQFGLSGTSTAWEAHVGGFVSGVVVAALFRHSLLRRVVRAR